MWMLYFVTFSIFILYHNKYKILLNIFSYLYPYMGWGKCSFQRADLVEGYGVRDIWITWKESERRTFWFFGFSSYLYKISFSFIIFFSQLYKKDWKWFFPFFSNSCYESKCYMETLPFTTLFLYFCNLISIGCWLTRLFSRH